MKVTNHTDLLHPAKQADKFTILRSMHSNGKNRERVTIHKTIGVDPRHEYQTFLDRPNKILDTGGMIPGLLA